MQDYYKVQKIVEAHISTKNKVSDGSIYRFLLREVFTNEIEVENFLLSNFGGYTLGQIKRIKRKRQSKDYLKIRN